MLTRLVILLCLLSGLVFGQAQLNLSTTSIDVERIVIAANGGACRVGL